jgi:hypothetical protein
VTRLLRGWIGLGAMALIGLSLVTGASAAGAQDAHGASGTAPAVAAPALLHTNPGHFVTPPQPHLPGTAYTDTSTNWAGQIANGNGTNFSAVAGQWTVPSVVATQYSGASATWIGIDGGPTSPNSIIQTGTAQETGHGATAYSSWYELYPAPAVTVAAVAPGDHMSASISQQTVGSTTWNLFIDDVTTGANHSFSLHYNGPGDSAEWIEELPTAVGGPQPTLANFGSATFFSMSATAAIPGAVTTDTVNMIDASNRVIASTGGIANGSFTVSYVQPPHGYWLVGSDGGIFTFGTANFYGSTGSLRLQRPVVGIVPTLDRSGYWLDASDGGVFSYGDTQFYGSIPGLGLHPAGSGLPHSLNAPIVGMVPSNDDNGYFMVASDGGVFAFGDAHFAGSCPGIGGCSGSAVAVMPDASGNGYWLVTSTGNIYTFGDAPYFGAPGHGTVTSAVASPDGFGYLVLLGSGQVFPYGDAANLGSPASTNFNGLDPATSIFNTSDGGGYWVSSALGAVYNFGDAPNGGGMSGTHLNGSIIAATGF